MIKKLISNWKNKLSRMFSDNVRITNLNCTCNACPTQYEGTLEDGRMIYVRYRWGYLSIRVSEDKTDSAYDAVRGKEVLGEAIGDDFNGRMEEKDIIKNLKRAGFIYEQPENGAVS